MSVQVKRRRDTAANLASFTGAQAELLVDTTNNRLQVHDGVTAGGWPTAKLAEVVTNTRISVADADHAALAGDRTIAFTALTAARTVTLSSASAYPTGTPLTVIDESGACSATNTITLAATGSDAIDGATRAVISSAYGYLALQSDGASKWTIVDQAASNLPAVGIGTPADPGNPLSVYATSALFASDSDMRVKLNKAASTNTASFLFQNSWSGRAEFGLTGDDDFRVKTSPDGAAWNVSLHARKSDGKVSFPQGLVHEASGAPIGNFIFTAGFPSPWFLTQSRSQLPRTSTIASIAQDIITLSGSTDANFFFQNAQMSGACYVRIWNITQSPHKPAWIKFAPAQNQLQVTTASDIFAWSPGDIVQIGDPALSSTQTAAVDISPMMQALFGTVFPQVGIIAKGVVSGPAPTAGLSATGASGTFDTITGTNAGDMISGTVITSSGTISPISNSNLLFVKEQIAAPNQLGTVLFSLIALLT